MHKFAVIDVGSNSVRLLFVADGTILYKRLNTTRLGEGIAQAPVLKPEAITRTAKAIAEFYSQAKAEGAEEVFAFATAAVRTAENRQVFLDEVSKLCGLTVDVVSGEEEAELGLIGALGQADGGVVDIGGASTEIVVKKDGVQIYKKSVNIGVVRLKDSCGRDNAALRSAASTAVESFGKVPTEERLYAIGGTATTLATQYLGLKEYDGKRVTGCVIRLEEMRALTEALTEKTVEEIAALPCMPKGRADVITGGAILLTTVMERLGFAEITVSDGDNLEGYAIKRGLMK